jgi:hypothetical protein
MKSLVVFSRDPGATQQLIAMLEALAGALAPGDAPGLAAIRAETKAVVGNVRVFARPPGDNIWRRSGFVPVAWSGCEDAAAATLLREANAGALLTGTSDINERGDPVLWRAARAAAIPSHVVLDQRVNLARRFIHTDGGVIHPDWVYVPDFHYAKLLAEAGVPSDRIRISGNIHMARLARLYASLSEAQIADQRKCWQVQDRRRIILFVSECGREMVKAGRPMPYDEIVVLENLMSALEATGHPAGAGEGVDAISVVVRPHPRDSVNKYQRYGGRRPSGLDIVVSTAGEPVVAIAAADIVVGMNSSLLHEAKAVGRPAMSLTGDPLADEPGATR